MAKGHGIGSTAKTDWTEWNEFQKWKAFERKTASEEAEKALEEANSVLEPSAIAPIRKRRDARKSWTRPPINGYSQKHSDVARHIASLRLANYTQQEAFESAAEQYELSPITVKHIFTDKPKLMQLATMELLETAHQEYLQNLWVIKTGLSDLGGKALRTLEKVIDDENASPSVKSKTAIAILKMLDADGSSNVNPEGKIALESLKIVREVTNKIQEKDSHIVDAEDAEFVKDDESESGADSELQ